MRETTPGIDIIGCHFHWCQTVWRKEQEVGLHVQYSEDIDINWTDKLDLLFNYVKRNWIDSSTLPQSTRNVYRKETRTNNDCEDWHPSSIHLECLPKKDPDQNDCEGWHQRINHCAMEIVPPMYCLIPIIFSEAEKLPLQKQMVEDGSLQRVQRRDIRDRQRQYSRKDTSRKSSCKIAKICGLSRL